VEVDLDGIGLSRGARDLLDSLSDPGDPPFLAALIVEAARIKHRLDKLDRLLCGDEDLWLRLVPYQGDLEVLQVKIDSGMQEARQQATVLRQLLAEIQRHKAPDEPDDDDALDGL
jgi:hypothetical protein